MDFLTLLRIEFKRSHVWLFVIVLLISIRLTDMRRFFEASYGGVTWFWIGGAAGSFTGTFPFGVAFAAWYGGRARRNQMDEVENSNRLFGLGSHAAALTCVLTVPLLVILPVFGVITYRTRENHLAEFGVPPGGPYPWQQIVILIAAFSAFMIWGYWLGYRVRSILVPIVAGAAMLLLLQIPQRTLQEEGGVSVFGAIIPTQINYEMAPYIEDHIYMPLARWGIAWFVLLGLIPVLLLRKWGLHRKFALVQTAITCVLALVCAVSVTNALQSARSWHAVYREMSCIEQLDVEYCSPPAAMSVAELEEVAAYYQALIPSWYPQAGIPQKISVGMTVELLPENSVMMVAFQHSVERNPDGYMKAVIYLILGPDSGDQRPNLTQLVVGCAMLLESEHDCDRAYPVPDFQYVPDASQSIEGQKILSDFMSSGGTDTEQLESDLGELQALTQQKLDTFMALSDAEKTAWLEANWDQLSSGDLSLNDMP